MTRNVTTKFIHNKYNSYRTKPNTSPASIVLQRVCQKIQGAHYNTNHIQLATPVFLNRGLPV